MSLISDTLAGRKPTEHRANLPALVSKKKQERFLQHLAKTGKVLESAKAAGYVNTSMLHRLRKEDGEFARRWEEALEAAADALEDEAIRRAVDGVEEPVFYQGEVVGHVTKYSDALLMFYLRGIRPNKFRDNVKVEGNMSGTFGVAVLPVTMANLDEWQRQSAALHAGMAALVPSPAASAKTIEGTVTPVPVVVKRS